MSAGESLSGKTVEISPFSSCVASSMISVGRGGEKSGEGGRSLLRSVSRSRFAKNAMFSLKQNVHLEYS